MHTPFIADNFYEEPPHAFVGANAAQVFERFPWQSRITPDGLVRYHREALVRLPDRAESFHLTDVFVYTSDGSDVELDYESLRPGEPPSSRVVIRVAIYRAAVDLETEWTSFERRWHERQAGKLAAPLPVPGDYPAETKKMAWVLPVADGYDAPAFEERVLFHSGGWSLRYHIACAAQAEAAATTRIAAFLRWIRALPGEAL